ncbi:MAG: helix-hairpin-helix domain-containing protein [Planctomycetaceae bacterium]|nr:helix-hairpin-helix domain-containing protein [Planctomycetaceae bacterium]
MNSADELPEQHSDDLQPVESDDPTSDEPSGVLLGLTESDRKFLMVAGSILLLLMGAYLWKYSSGGRETIEIKRLGSQEYVYQLDINEANWVEWMQLDGVGDVLARRIVADREENGPFTSVEDLDRVKGIGPATLERLRPHLMMTSDGTDE